MRLPQVSSNTALVTGPISVAPCVKRTPSPLSRSDSVRTSWTVNEANGMRSLPWLTGLAGCVTTVGTGKTDARVAQDEHSMGRCPASARTLLLPRDTVLNHQMHSDDPLP